MGLRDDERAFREAVATGLSAAEAVQLLNVPPKMVTYFTRRLPKVTQAIAPQAKPVAIPAPLPPPVVTVTDDYEGDTDLDEQL